MPTEAAAGCIHWRRRPRWRQPLPQPVRGTQPAPDDGELPRPADGPDGGMDEPACARERSLFPAFCTQSGGSYTLKINPADLELAPRTRFFFSLIHLHFRRFSEGPFTECPAERLSLKFSFKYTRHEQQDQVIYPFISRKTNKIPPFLPFPCTPSCSRKGHQISACFIRNPTLFNESFTPNTIEIHNESHYRTAERTIEAERLTFAAARSAVGTCDHRSRRRLRSLARKPSNQIN